MNAIEGEISTIRREMLYNMQQVIEGANSRRGMLYRVQHI